MAAECAGYPEEHTETENAERRPRVRHWLCEQSPHLAAECPKYRAAMDPLQVLPDEMVLRILSLLPPLSLLSLCELGGKWRRLAGDDSVWRNRTLDLEKECDMEVLKQVRSFKREVPGMLIENYWYRHEPAWVDDAIVEIRPRILHVDGNISVGLLRQLSPFLEQLGVDYVMLGFEEALEEIFEAICDMRVLRRLRMKSPSFKAVLKLCEQQPPKLEWLALHLWNPDVPMMKLLSKLPALHELIVSFADCVEVTLPNVPLPVSLEALTIEFTNDKHLHMIQNMPRLRRLKLRVTGSSDFSPDWANAPGFPEQLEELELHGRCPSLQVLQRLPKLSTFKFSPSDWETVTVPSQSLLPPEHPGLKRLIVPLHVDLFRESPSAPNSLVALLQATQAKLERLEVSCSTSTTSQSALVDLLRQCQFGALRLVWLSRWNERFSLHHTKQECAEQLQAARDVMASPAVSIVCRGCSTSRSRGSKFFDWAPLNF